MMKFEEILSFLREGKKVKRNRWEDGEYLTTCITTLIGAEKFEDLTQEQKQERLDFLIFKKDFITSKIGIVPPYLYCPDIMANDWEIVEEKKA